MGTKYTSKSQSGFNVAPPPDDGSAGTNNVSRWGDVLAKIGTPLLSLVQAMNIALTNALDFGGNAQTSNYITAPSDHMKTIECTGTFTVTLGDAATMAAGMPVGYTVTIKSLTDTISIALQTGGNTLDGAGGGTAIIPAGAAATYKVNTALNGYYLLQATNAVTAGTVTTAAQPNITSVGTLTSLDVSGTVTCGEISTSNFTGNVTGNVSGTSATVTGAAQTNITSVGTLTSLAVSGNETIGGSLTVTGAITGTVTGGASLCQLSDAGIAFPIGTIAVMNFSIAFSGTVAALGTTAGSNFTYGYASSGNPFTTTPPGTWRNVTGVSISSTNVNLGSGLFQRIS